MNALLSLSGKDAWFVKPLNWKQPDAPSCEVQRVKRKPDEPGPDYAARVQNGAGNLGVARGIKSLGIRVPASNTDKSKGRVKTWRVAGVATEWGA